MGFASWTDKTYQTIIYKVNTNTQVNRLTNTKQVSRYISRHTSKKTSNKPGLQGSLCKVYVMCFSKCFTLLIYALLSTDDQEQQKEFRITQGFPCASDTPIPLCMNLITDLKLNMCSHETFGTVVPNLCFGIQEITSWG